MLDARAAELSESGNGLAQRLLDEGLRTDRHPLIHFRSGGAGVRRPALVGRRLFVWQVISTLRESGNSVEVTSEYLALSQLQVRACLSYYAEFEDEVDAAARQERDVAEREEARWKREQEALA
jgi:uncharacterized protein (DUF433 family)